LFYFFFFYSDKRKKENKVREEKQKILAESEEGEKETEKGDGGDNEGENNGINDESNSINMYENNEKANNEILGAVQGQEEKSDIPSSDERILRSSDSLSRERGKKSTNNILIMSGDEMISLNRREKREDSYEDVDDEKEETEKRKMIQYKNQTIIPEERGGHPFMFDNGEEYL
jgi:hypothetical protein